MENSVSIARQQREEQEQESLMERLNSSIGGVSDSNISVKNELSKLVEKTKQASIQNDSINLINQNDYATKFSMFNARELSDAIEGALSKALIQSQPPPIPIPLPITIERESDFSRDSTLEDIKNGLEKEPSIYSNIKDGLNAAVTQLKQVGDYLIQSKDFLFSSMGIEQDTLDAIREQNERYASQFLRDDAEEDRKLTIFNVIGEKLKENLKEAFEDLDIHFDGRVSNTYRVFGGLFGFLGALTSALMPFMGIIAGGAIVAVLVSSFEFFTEFERTGRAFQQLLDGGFLNAIPNLINLFGAVGEDLGNMVQTTERFDRLVSAIGDIFTNHLFPAMEYLFNLLSEMVVSLSDYLQGEGGQKLTDSLISFSYFVTDVLIFFFESVLPPILDTIGFAFRTAETAIRATTPAFVFIFTEMLPGLLRGIERQFTAIGDYIQNIIDDFAAIFNSENPIQFANSFTNVSVSLSGFVLSTIDNILSTIMDVFAIDDLLGVEDGTLVSEMLSDLFSSLSEKFIDFVSNVRDAFVEKIDEITDYIMSLDPLELIIDKIQMFVNSIVDLIPTPADILNGIRGFVTDIPLIPDAVRDRLLGVGTVQASEIQSPATVVPGAIREIQAREELTRELNMIINTPQTQVQPRQTPGISRPSGVPRTSPNMTPSDRVLYGFGELR